MTNPYTQYKQQSLSTLTPGEIVVRLFEEASKQLHSATLSIEEKDFAKANEALIKAQQIFAGLTASLDMRYPISLQLRELYQFVLQELRMANIKKDTAMIGELLPLIEDFRDTFRQAEKLSRIQ